MEEKGFNYIENLAVVQLDQSKIGSTTLSNNKNTAKQPQEQQPKKADKSKITSFFKKKDCLSTLLTLSTTGSSEDKTESQESAEETKTDIFETISKNPEVQASEIFCEGESEYFKKSKKVLLMFRRVSKLYLSKANN